MVAHARSEAPKECCGFLVGRDRRVDLAIPLTNVAPRPRTAFRVDPAEHIAVRRILRRAAPGVQILGVYHSHPAGPASPSPSDLAEAHYPDWIFAIVGRSGGSVRAFQIRLGVAQPVRVHWR